MGGGCRLCNLHYAAVERGGRRRPAARRDRLGARTSCLRGGPPAAVAATRRSRDMPCDACRAPDSGITGASGRLHSTSGRRSSRRLGCAGEARCALGRHGAPPLGHRDRTPSMRACGPRLLLRLRCSRGIRHCAESPANRGAVHGAPRHKHGSSPCRPQSGVRAVLSRDSKTLHTPQADRV